MTTPGSVSRRFRHLSRARMTMFCLAATLIGAVSMSGPVLAQDVDTLVTIKGSCVSVDVPNTNAMCAAIPGVLFTHLRNGRALITFALDNGHAGSFIGEKDSQPKPELYYLYLSRFRIATGGSDFVTKIGGQCVIHMSRDGSDWSQIDCDARDENDAPFVLHFVSNNSPVTVNHPGSTKTSPVLPNGVSAAIVNSITAKFRKTLQATGITGVGLEVQACYDDAGTTPAAIAPCMLYDIAARKLDQGMMAAFTARGMNAVPASYFTDRAFGTRTKVYTGLAFGGSSAASARFYGDAPNRVMLGIVNPRSGSPG